MAEEDSQFETLAWGVSPGTTIANPDPSPRGAIYLLKSGAQVFAPTELLMADALKPGADAPGYIHSRMYNPG